MASKSGDEEPVEEVKQKRQISDFEAFAHVLKASLGTGILSLPNAFMHSGLGVGLIGLPLISLICTHCAYVLVKCGQEMCDRIDVPTITYSGIAESCCTHGPDWAKKFAYPARIFALCLLFVTYVTTCSCYSVIVMTNVNHVLEYFLNTQLNIRITLLIYLIPLILLVYIPDLKYLAPVSLVANMFMLTGLAITMFYLLSGLQDLGDRKWYGTVIDFPVFMSVCIYSIECIGVVMPIRNAMKTPRNMIGLCGVWNRGMFCVTVIYGIVGFCGYLRFGEITAGSITTNLPKEDVAPQVTNIFIAFSIFCTTGLQFVVCLEIGWNCIKDNFNESMFANYVLRTVLITMAIMFSVAVPQIIPFVSIIGAFCFSILGIMTPIVMEIITFWHEGFRPFTIIKDVIIIIFGMCALIFGTNMSVRKIIAIYTGSGSVDPLSH